jgi:hypothetical protein
VRPDGSPNLSPKGSVRVYDDEHLALMNIASPRTITNLTADPRIEMNSVDVLRRRGYRSPEPRRFMVPECRFTSGYTPGCSI